MRYFADYFDGDGGYYVFDVLDGGSEVCGPFDYLSNAEIAANDLNDNNCHADGLRPHQVQHALESDRKRGLPA